MTLRQIFIAAAILLAAVYLKSFLPAHADELVPAIRQVLAEEQAVIYMPEDWMIWQDWN